MIRVLLADDHQITLEGLKLILEQYKAELEVVGMVNTGEEALRFIREKPVDIAVLDIGMSGMKEGETLDALKAFPGIKSLILTMYGDEKHVKKMLDCGARGYVLKDNTGEELVDAIRTVMQGEPYFSPQVAQTVAKSQVIKDQPNEMPRITSRELEVLKLLYEEMSAKMIADRLCISEKTVERHKSNMMSKIGVRTDRGLVIFYSENLKPKS